jgi:hypothetical protein
MSFSSAITAMQKQTNAQSTVQAQITAAPKRTMYVKKNHRLIARTLAGRSMGKTADGFQTRS